MNDNKKLMTGILLGLIGGGAAGYFLNSKDGKKFKKATKRKANELRTEIKEKLKSNSEIISETLDMVSQSATEFVEQNKEVIKNKYLSAKDYSEQSSN